MLIVRLLKCVGVGNESINIYRSPTGGVFGIDSSAIADDAFDVFVDPFTSLPFDIDLAEEGATEEAKSHPDSWWCCGKKYSWDEKCDICNGSTD